MSDTEQATTVVETTVVETTVTETTAAAEPKKSKRELMAERIDRDVKTVVGLLDLDTDTGAVSCGDQVLPATLLPDMTMDIMQRAQEQTIYTTNIVAAATTQMAAQAYKLNAGLQKTNASIPMIGKDAIEVDTNRDGSVIVRHKVMAVNDKAGNLKGTVNSFRDAMMALAKSEQETAAKS